MNKLPAEIPSVTAFVLAGGRSRRMGSDKAFLSYRNEPLIHHPIRACRTFTTDVRIIGDPERYACFGLPVIPDSGESRGPLTGIHTALQHSPTPFCSITACDMPLVSPEFFTLMLRKLPGPDVVVMRFSDGTVEPLCGIYSCCCLGVIEDNLANGRLKITDMFSRLAVEYINEEELHECGLSRSMFANVNTPDDLDRLHA